MRMRLAFVVFSWVLVFFSAGCGGGSNSSPHPAPTLASIAVTTPNASVPLGLTAQLSATGTYSDGSRQDLTRSVAWVSSAGSVASVSVSGLLTTLAQGGATITASSGAISGILNVTVGAPVLQSITVSPANNTLPLGESQQLAAVGNYSDKSTQEITNATWSSSVPAVATINSTGLLMTRGVGTTTITVTSGSVNGSTNFVVSPPALASISVTPGDESIPAGLVTRLTATGTFTDGTAQTLSSVNWSSSDLTVATVDSTGRVRTFHQGAVTLTASSGEISGSVLFDITAPVLSMIMVSPPSVSVFVGAASPVSFVATGHWTDGSTADISSSVTWNITLPFVASIDANGSITGNRAGYTEVYASLGKISSAPNARLIALAHPRYAFLTSDTDRAITRATIDEATGRLRWEGYQPTGIHDSAFECVTADRDSKFLYVGHLVPPSPANGQLEIYSLDNSKGTLTQITGSPFTLDVPLGCITFEPSGRFGYAIATYNNTNNQLVTFSRDGNTGQLTQVNSIALPSEPSTVAIDPSGRFLYTVAQYITAGSQAFAYGFAIDPGSGTLNPIVGTPFQVPNGAGAFTFHPSGRYAYLSESGGNSIDAYSVDSTTGKLTFVSSVSPCINPTTLRFSPSGANHSSFFAYSACSMDNDSRSNSGTVQGFSIANDGGLAPVSHAPGANAPFDVHIDSAGDYLYLTSNGNYISEYVLDQFTGEISTNGKIGTHALPFSMLITGGSSPVTYTPNYAFVASKGDNKITSYVVGNDGTFSSTQSVSSQVGPFSLSAVPWGNQLLAASSAPGGALTPYSISGQGALTTGQSFGQSTRTAGVIMDPSGIWAIDVDAAANGVYTYGNFNGIWDLFTYIPPSSPPFSLFATGTTPGPIAIDDSGRYVFVGNQGANSITVFEHSGTGMELFERTSAYTAPYPDGSPYALPATPLQMAMDSNGTFLHVLCSDQTVRVFSIDYDSGGHITSADNVTLAGTAEAIAVVPGTSLFFAADSFGVYGYSVDPSTGRVVAAGTGSSVALSNINGLYPDPSGTSLYVTTSTSGTGAVYAFKVDKSGQLTPVSANPIATPNQPSSMAFTATIQ